MSKSKKKGLGKGGISSRQIAPYDNNGFYQNNPYPIYENSNGLTTKDTIQYSLLGILLAGGAVLIGKKIIHKAVTTREQEKTIEDGSIPTYAKQIKMAFQNDGWWGTNVSELRDTMRQIPDKRSFNKVMASYQKLYQTSMLGDMQKALKSTEYDEMIAIVSAKPDSKNDGSNSSITSVQLTEWSKRLKAAFDSTFGIIPTPDKGAIKAVFLEIPTQDVWEQVKTTYQSMYGSDLSSDLKGKLSFWDYDPMIQLINSKPTS